MTLGMPVNHIPEPGNRNPGASGRNQRMLEQFVKSGNAAQMVNYGPMDARTARTSLTNSIRLNGYPVRVIMRGASIYLARKPATNDTPIVEM